MSDIGLLCDLDKRGLADVLGQIANNGQAPPDSQIGVSGNNEVANAHELDGLEEVGHGGDTASNIHGLPF